MHQHLAPSAANALARVEVADEQRLGAWITGLTDWAAHGIIRARQAGDEQGQLAWSAEMRRCIELRGKLAHLIGAPATIQIDVDARRQVAVFAELSTDELRALAAQAQGAPPSPRPADVLAGT